MYSFSSIAKNTRPLSGNELTADAEGSQCLPYFMISAVPSCVQAPSPPHAGSRGVGLGQSRQALH
jgi:hypothetical protein